LSCPARDRQLRKFAPSRFAHDARKRPSRILIALSASVMLAGCGGGGGGGSGSGDPNTQPAPGGVTEVAVPYVIGLSPSAATSSLAAAGLSVGQITQRVSPGIPLGRVVIQVPDAGMLVAPASAVNLFVSAELGFIGETEPAPGALVPDEVSVLVRIQSSYEISEVVASAAGRDTTLAYVPDSRACTRGCPAYVGTLSLAGLPMGPYTITLRARDARGNADERAINVIHDNPPQLSITQPIEGSVVLGAMPVDARCSDDAPGCVVEVMFDTGVPASSPMVLNTTVDFSGVTGGFAHLTVRARDSANQASQVLFGLYFEDPARLSVVAQTPGEILDANETKLLYLRPPADLAIYDRANGTTEAIPLPSGRIVTKQTARLTSSGAVFETHNGTALGVEQHLWRLGTLEPLPGNGGLTASASGGFALSSAGSSLYLIDTGAGIATLVASNAGNTDNAVLDDGTVVFWTSDYQLVRYRDGQQTMLTNDPNYVHVHPRASETGVVFRKRTGASSPQVESIVLIEGGAEIALSGPRTSFASAGRDYERADAWTAYTDVGPQGQWHVFTRSPLGEIKRHTDLSSSSSVDRLGSNGEVMIRSGNQRYFSDGARLLPLSSSSGESYRLAGGWYVAIGSTFLAVDTD
jgi:hypothetical protein